MTAELAQGCFYIAASILFVVGLKMLGSPTTARKGNMVSAAGMLIAMATTLAGMTQIKWIWIITGVCVGSLVGVLAAQFVKMTSMPQMVGLLNGFGGLASMLVGWSEFHAKWAPAEATRLFTLLAIFLTILAGAVTFTGSLVAYGKLSGALTGRPLLYKGRNLVNMGLLVVIVVLGMFFFTRKLDQLDETGLESVYILLMGIMALSLALGVLTTIGIGGADMPVIICLLNSYSGLAACAAGFIIGNTVLVVSGSLVGASGIILTNIMCKAMNRSLANVLFSGFGSAGYSKGGVQGEVKPISVQDAYLILEAARNVVFVPGYGMAAAQAQHVVCELGELLERNGTVVKYCIHPVAGRMPGHMNVLLAEADVPYELLVEPQDVNPTMTIVDVAVVIGANDVVNPAAREDPSSPLWGMPIVEVDRAKTCVVLKRSMSPGFAGVDNPLFLKENTRMLFGDARASVGLLVSEFKR